MHRRFPSPRGMHAHGPPPRDRRAWACPKGRGAWHVRLCRREGATHQGGLRCGNARARWQATALLLRGGGREARQLPGSRRRGASAADGHAHSCWAGQATTNVCGGTAGAGWALWPTCHASSFLPNAVQPRQACRRVWWRVLLITSAAHVRRRPGLFGPLERWVSPDPKPKP